MSFGLEYLRTFKVTLKVLGLNGLSNEDEVSCLRTQHCTPDEIRTRDLAIKSLALYQLSLWCSL